MSMYNSSQKNLAAHVEDQTSSIKEEGEKKLSTQIQNATKLQFKLRSALLTGAFGMLV